MLIISDKVLFYLVYLQGLQRGIGEGTIRDTIQIVLNQRPVKSKIIHFMSTNNSFQHLSTKLNERRLQVTRHTKPRQDTRQNEKLKNDA